MVTNQEKSALSPKQCTMSQVNHNDGKSTWTALWIASAPTLFSRSGPQQQLAVCRPQKNAPMKKWYRKLRQFWGQRQIVLQKRYQIVREALESVYHPRKRLCWWIKSNFAQKLFYQLSPGLIGWCVIYIYWRVYILAASYYSSKFC